MLVVSAGVPSQWQERQPHSCAKRSGAQIKRPEIRSLERGRWTVGPGKQSEAGTGGVCSVLPEWVSGSLGTRVQGSGVSTHGRGRPEAGCLEYLHSHPIGRYFSFLLHLFKAATCTSSVELMSTPIE